MLGSPGDVPTDEKGGTLTAPGITLSDAQTKYLATSAFLDGSRPITMTGESGSIGFNGFDFCWEGWFYPTAVKTHVLFAKKHDSLAVRGILVIISNVSGWRVSLAVADTSSSTTWDVLITSSAIVEFNSWMHVAITRSGGTYRLFMNGILQGEETWGGVPADDTADFIIGQAPWSSSVNNFQGYMSDIRVTRGAARYTSDFSVPSAPFPITQC